MRVKAKEYLKRFPVNEENSATERARQAIEYGVFTVGMNIYGDASLMQGKVFMLTVLNMHQLP